MKVIERSVIEGQLEKVKEFFNDRLLKCSMPLYHNWSQAYGLVMMSAIELDRIPKRDTVLRWLRNDYCPNGYRLITTLRRLALLNGYQIEQLTKLSKDKTVMDFPFTLSLEFNKEQREWIDLHMNVVKILN